MPAAAPRRRFAVSLHDVAPATWPRCERLLALCDRHAIPVTLLVVPRFHDTTPVDTDPAFAAAVRARVAGGDEVVLHGYFHRDDAPAARGPLEWLRRRFYTASEGEFDALDEAGATLRLRDGCARLARAGLVPAGFIAPAWLLGRAARRAVVAAGFAYTSTREQLIDLKAGRRLAAPSLVYATRSAWRRAASRAVLAVRLALLARAPFVRVALHPGDADHAQILSRWDRTLSRLGRTRAPVLETTCLGLPAAAAGSDPIRARGR